jgi:hypothetical protein
MNEDTPTRRFDADDGASRGLVVGQRVFGRYALEAIAGRGGMGVVWRGRDEKLGRVVALTPINEKVATWIGALQALTDRQELAGRDSRAKR